MLTLEQAHAVNDGFHGGDLNAALQPLEETIDLRANELPRLDKRAVAALKHGLQNGDDAATWAQAILHPNISVRRFARKVFLGLGDEAAPIFAPLRARLERFWNEEAPLPESSKPREAALRREQNEQVASALEILLRADPERFMEFYAQLADNAPDNSSHVEQNEEARAWSERNQAAFRATQEETTRLLKAEWGEKFADYGERWKLPSRVLRELDERARATPEIAKLWAELGEAPQGNSVAPAWHPAGLLSGTWASYLSDYQATGPIKRVQARLRPVLWDWMKNAFDFERPFDERAQLMKRLGRGHIGYWLSNYLGAERLIEEAPALLLASKARLLPTLQETLKTPFNYGRRQEIKGEGITAELWLSLATALGARFRKPYSVKPEDWQPPAIALETLREIIAEFPTDDNSARYLADLRIAMHDIEAAQTQRDAPATPVEETQPEPARVRFQISASDALGTAQIQQIYAQFKDSADRNDSYQKISDESNRQAEAVAQQIVALDDETRWARLINAPHPNVEGAHISRAIYLNLWTRDMKLDEAAQWRARFVERVTPQLWARLEEQLDAHRRLETEPIEPDIKEKLTERETKEWRARVRREKRAVIAADAHDIAQRLGYFGGVAAHLRAIEMADRPGCRAIRDQLENGAFACLEQAPDNSQFVPRFFENGAVWRNWMLDETWDAVIAKLEVRLQSAPASWERNNLERQLATGYYRRGDFAGFERWAKNPDAFPYNVSTAASALEDFEVWQVLVGVADGWKAGSLKMLWDAQIADEARKARPVEAVAQVLALTNAEKVAKNLLDWVKPLAACDFAAYAGEVENALESAIANVKKWAMLILSALPDAKFDRERAAQTAGEALWNENAGLAKDAAKFLSVVALHDSDVAAVAWDALCDATSLENVGLCEAVYRALTKIKSKRKSLELSEAAREKLAILSQAQNERFGKFEAKL